MVATKQLKVRLINKITGILASKFKRRRFVAMDSPQKGNDDFDRSLSLFSLPATGEHDDDNRTIIKQSDDNGKSISMDCKDRQEKLSSKTPQRLFKIVYLQVVFLVTCQKLKQICAYKNSNYCADSLVSYVTSQITAPSISVALITLVSLIMSPTMTGLLSSKYP